VVHICNPSMRKVEAVGFWVPDQCGLHSSTPVSSLLIASKSKLHEVRGSSFFLFITTKFHLKQCLGYNRHSQILVELMKEHEGNCSSCCSAGNRTLRGISRAVRPIKRPQQPDKSYWQRHRLAWPMGWGGLQLELRYILKERKQEILNYQM
jgi:hypothetical protein